MIAAASVALPQASPPASKTTESEHRKGPHGLEGWTLEAPVPGIYDGKEPLPFALVIARNGRILHRFGSGPFVWNWIFWADGKQIAYETGPLHFGLTCVLADVATGRELREMDCFHGLTANAPDWAKSLEGSAARN